MIDFHSHILPAIDDGASNVNESIMMLRESYRQGVDTVFATPHFYADSDDPDRFLARRERAYDRLIREIEKSPFAYPQIYLGAEILYFPGMCEAEELSKLMLGHLPCLLVEPPMIPWTTNIIDEIEKTGFNLHCIPIIAHIDRYMLMLNDFSLVDRLQGRKILIQVNATFFTNKFTKDLALRFMKEGKIHFLGSDCHNLADRPPNLILTVNAVRAAGAMKEFSVFTNKEKLFLEIG